MRRRQRRHLHDDHGHCIARPHIPLPDRNSAGAIADEQHRAQSNLHKEWWDLNPGEQQRLACPFPIARGLGEGVEEGPKAMFEMRRGSEG